MLIALDRMERSGKDDALSAHSAVQEVTQSLRHAGDLDWQPGRLAGILVAAPGPARTLAQHKDAVLPIGSAMACT